MEGNFQIKKCEVCRDEAKYLCDKCMQYFCDSCFQIAHKNEETKFHTKGKIDYFCPIDTKCLIHKTHPLDLFCIDEKGKLHIFIKYLLTIFFKNSFMLPIMLL